MPSFKSIINLCLLLLFTSIPGQFVSAQSNEPKIEVGAQFSVLGGGTDYWFNSPTSVGGGARLTFNLTKYLALEGELNYFPSTGFNNFRSLQGQFGVKSGLRFDRFGIFGKVRPGFANTEYDFQALCGQSPCFPAAIDDTEFSLDVGGVLEFYPSRRMIVRFDVGDTIVNRGAPPVLFSNGFIAPGGNYATHNLQLSAGVGFRF
jgi:Outer membrane protein beta-barrel domain